MHINSDFTDNDWNVQFIHQTLLKFISTCQRHEGFSWKGCMVVFKSNR